jgi:hypothetical protein
MQTLNPTHPHGDGPPGNRPTVTKPQEGNKMLSKDEIEALNRLTQAIIHFDNLADGIAINPDAKVVTFRSQQSAQEFKDAHPEFWVQFLNRGYRP